MPFPRYGSLRDDDGVKCLTTFLKDAGVHMTHPAKPKAMKEKPMDGFRMPAVAHMFLPNRVVTAVEHAMWSGTC